MATRKNTTSAENSPGRWLRLRPRVLLGLAMLLVLGYLGHLAWQRHVPAVRRHPDYAITADRIQIPSQPAWLRSDICQEVLQNAQLSGTLSLLDDGESLRCIKDAFEFHPWVESVERVEKRLPAGLDVQLTYRRPAAAVESADSQMDLLVVDASAIRLPEADLSEGERRYLPRITGVLDRPQVGQKWTDPRVVSGVRLAVGLAEVWRSLRLVEIVPRHDVSAANGDSSGWSFNVLTSGGTRIVWGAAPGEEPPDESAFEQKLEKLQSYASEYGNLGTIFGPEELDVRSELRIQPREARRDGDKKVAADDSSAADDMDGEQTGDRDEPVEEIAARDDESEEKH